MKVRFVTACGCERMMEVGFSFSDMPRTLRLHLRPPAPSASDAMNTIPRINTKSFREFANDGFETNMFGHPCTFVFREIITNNGERK